MSNGFSHYNFTKFRSNPLSQKHILKYCLVLLSHTFDLIRSDLIFFDFCFFSQAQVAVADVMGGPDLEMIGN